MYGIQGNSIQLSVDVYNENLDPIVEQRQKNYLNLSPVTNKCIAFSQDDFIITP
jgi:hypothetical protein